MEKRYGVGIGFVFWIPPSNSFREFTHEVIRVLKEHSNMTYCIAATALTKIVELLYLGIFEGLSTMSSICFFLETLTPLVSRCRFFLAGDFFVLQLLKWLTVGITGLEMLFILSRHSESFNLCFWMDC